MTSSAIQLGEKQLPADQFARCTAKETIEASNEWLSRLRREALAQRENYDEENVKRSCKHVCMNNLSTEYLDIGVAILGAAKNVVRGCWTAW